MILTFFHVWEMGWKKKKKKKKRNANLLVNTPNLKVKSFSILDKKKKDGVQ